MNNSGQIFDVGRKSIFWIIAGIMITIVVLAFAFTLGNYRNQLTEVPLQTRAELISFRFTTLPECLAYVDAAGMVHHGTLDLAKFTDEQLLSCYKTADIGDIATFNFRLVLEKDGSFVTTDQYYKHDDFTLYQEVLVEKNNELLKDRLIIYVQEEEVRG